MPCDEFLVFTVLGDFSLEILSSILLCKQTQEKSYRRTKRKNNNVLESRSCEEKNVNVCSRREFYKFLPYEAEEPEINGIINSFAVRLSDVLVFQLLFFSYVSLLFLLFLFSVYVGDEISKYFGHHLSLGSSLHLIALFTFIAEPFSSLPN